MITKMLFLSKQKGTVLSDYSLSIYIQIIEPTSSFLFSVSFYFECLMFA